LIYVLYRNSQLKADYLTLNNILIIICIIVVSFKLTFIL
jgi:hypothetical protein